MLDVAQALFEIRRRRDGARNPDALWSEIAAHYLHIAPHPEWSWWEWRGVSASQAVDNALGAMVAADVRTRLNERPNPFSRRDLYERLTGDLYRHGQSRPAGDMLLDFLGRRLNTRAILAELQEMGRGS
jgi:hypothetical protein